MVSKSASRLLWVSFPLLSPFVDSKHPNNSYGAGQTDQIFILPIDLSHAAQIPVLPRLRPKAIQPKGGGVFFFKFNVYI